MRRASLALAAFLLAAPGYAQEASRLAELLDADSEAFPRAVEPRDFVFPGDHGPHPEYRNEWWYVTGNLEEDGGDGRRFGFELTIFRFALKPEPIESTSDWRTNQVYIAHLALTDVAGERFYVAEKYSRGALGLAGAKADPFAVWIDDWRIESREPRGQDRAEAWRLVAGSETFSVDLELDATKPPVLNGDAGLSQKSSDPGNASYYYSITRLATEGGIRVGDRRFTVSGTSWLDREWSSSALGANQLGWDWFALQLDDDTELMFYNLRLIDGRQDVNSAGTFVLPNGDHDKLLADEVSLEVLDTWDSPDGGRYPARWRVQVPGRGIDVEIVPVLADQELDTTVRYWEGAVDVSGTSRGKPVSGRGYVELTGYSDDSDD